MKITIQRTDPAMGMPDTHKPGLLSHEDFDNWTAVFDSLRQRGIPLTAAHEVEFRAHPTTDFRWNEFIKVAASGYMCNVQYLVKVSAE